MSIDQMVWTAYEVVCNESQDRFPVSGLDLADQFLDMHEAVCNQGHIVYRVNTRIEYATEGAR